jgi:tripartite-type tricarboxylate transporter receptor subunit TctC
MNRFAAGVLGAVLAMAVAPAQSQDFPNKPVRILVPFAPGGVVDVAARIVGQKLSEKWGQQVLVENRPGGNGFIAVTAVARAPADGYTLLMAHTGEFSVNPAVFKDIPYELERDFNPITLVSDAPMVIAVKSDGPYQTAQALIEAARAKPGTVGMGTPGTGSINHLAGEWFGLGAGVKFLHVPYRGGAPAMTATAAGEVPFGVAAISSGLSHIQSGRVKVLAVTTGKRAAFNPDWPTAQEVGAKGVDTSIWTGLFAPKGVPQPVLDKIYNDVAAVLALPDVQERFKAGGATTGGMKPAEFAAKVKSELARLKEIVQAANVKPE